MREPRTVAEGREKALALRYSHNLSTSPIPDLFGFIERVFPDTMVIRRPMPDGPVGALVRAGLDWLIIVNTYISFLARQRFTAAHELGHRLFDADRGDLYEQNLFITAPAETRANAFAVNLLLPSTVLRARHHDGGLDPDHDEQIIALAVEYGLSLSSLSFHLKNNDIISEKRRNEIAAIKSPLAIAAKLGLSDRVTEERQARSITRWPSRYVRLAFSARDNGHIDQNEFAALLEQDRIVCDAEQIDHDANG